MEIKNLYQTMTNLESSGASEQKEIHQAVLDSAPDAVIVVDMRGSIVMCNHQVMRLFGYDKHELIGKQIELLIPKRYVENHRSERNRYSIQPTVKGMGERKELSARRKDGSEFYAEISLSPVAFSDNVLIISSIRDVSEKIELNHKLQQSLNTLEDKNAELEQLTYIVSHDLKSPLKTIIGLANILKSRYQGKADNETTSILNMMEQTTQRAISLIVDLLDFSLVGTKREKEQINCNSLLLEIKTDLDQMISNNQVSLTIGELPTLSGYETELRQLFQNLVVNAIKFRKPDINPIITIRSTEESNAWHFSIQDNGIGIDSVHFEKIFQAFQRLHRKEEYDGTGIGLATCQKIVKLHEGKIWVDSELNKGSTFHFTISKSL